MCTAAREASSSAASSSRDQRAAACGVLHDCQTDIHLSGNKITILCQSEHQKIPPHAKHPRLKKHFFSARNSTSKYVPASYHDKHQRCYVPHAYSAAHITATHLPAGIDRVRTHASASLMRTCAGVLCLTSNGDWHSRSLKNYVGKDEGDRTGLGCELLYW